MIHPHNPIMQRLEEMAKLWKQQVASGHLLIRWMLKPEDSRMYEGFCRLEASQHGFLDNLFVFFFTPFQSAEAYSHALMENWLREYDENIQQRQALAASGLKGDWEPMRFREAVTARRYELCHALLPEMMVSYRQWLGMPSTDIVLAVLPNEMQSPTAFSSWLQSWVKKEPPAGLQLLVFDHKAANFYEEVFRQHAGKAVTLQHDLRMQQAVREIATAGAATDPHAAFRKCMFEMGEAAGRKDLDGLHAWGQRALDTGKTSGDKDLLATAYITYAGMLFNFRQHSTIDTLLEDGMQLCRRQVAAGNEAMKSLLLQYYAYKGSHCQLQRQRKEALGWFMRMGEEAVAFGFIAQAISAWYKGFTFARYKNFESEKNKFLMSCVRVSDRLSMEEIQSSEYPFVAFEFIREGEGQGSAELRMQVDAQMVEAYGPNWQEDVEEMRKNYTKAKLTEAQLCT